MTIYAKRYATTLMESILNIDGMGVAVPIESLDLSELEQLIDELLTFRTESKAEQEFQELKAL